MTKIDIISGFLGAGKTTLIKKLLSEAFTGEQVVLIENEFGEIGIDGGFLKESGIEIREMNSGCICCSLVGDFGKSLREVVDTYHPDRILIEPSGVGKLSDVIKAVQDVQAEIDAELNSFTTVVDVTKCRIYRKNFGEFFSNQIEYAGAVILSRTDKAKPEKIEESVALLRELNDKAPFITTPIAQLPGKKILETMESGKSLEEELLDEIICPECGHNFLMRLSARSAVIIMKKVNAAVTTTIMSITMIMITRDMSIITTMIMRDMSITTTMTMSTIIMTMQAIIMQTMCSRAGDVRQFILMKALESDSTYGNVLRAKGMVAGADGEWIYFDMVPEEHEVRTGAPEYTGRICVIGAELNEDKLAELFGLA